jgi:hypothetical protein
MEGMREGSFFVEMKQGGNTQIGNKNLFAILTLAFLGCLQPTEGNILSLARNQNNRENNRCQGNVRALSA